MKQLLIVGATGALGSAATKHFLKRNYPVRAFVRNKTKAANLEEAGAEVFSGDITNPTSLIEACKNVDVVIACVHGILGKGKNRSANIDDKGHKSLVDAAVKGGVKRFIYSSISGVSENSPIDFYSTKYVVEQYIQRSGIGYTILRLPAFMETDVQQLLGKSIIEKGKATILGKGDNPTNFIAVDDVVQAMEPIIESSNYENKVVQIAGPENLSRNEVVKLYASALNIKPRIRHVPVAVLNVLSKVINPFHEGIGRIMRFSAYNDIADATMDPSYSILRFGLQPTTVETFIRKQVAAGKRV